MNLVDEHKFFWGRRGALSLALAAALMTLGTTSFSIAGASSLKLLTVSAAKNAVKQFESTSYAGPIAIPTTGPAAQKGKKVWVIQLAAAAEGSSEPAQGAYSAAKAIGWNVKLVDGQDNYTLMSTEIDEAIAAKVNGIILVAIDCPYVSGALKRATAAGIKVYGELSFDCNNSIMPKKSAPLFSATLNNFGSIGSYGDYVVKELEQADLDYIVANGGTSAQIINFEETDTYITHWDAVGWNTDIKQCPTCKVYNYTMAFSTLLAGNFAAEVSAALAAHPSAQWIVFPYDAAYTLGGAEAISSAHSHIKVVSVGGTASALSLVRQGKQTMTVNNSGMWNGWAAVDGLNRLFAGDPQVNEGVQAQIDTKGSNPTGQIPVNFEAAYKKIWGIK